MRIKNLFTKKTPMPLPVALNDCLLLHQMGYRVVVHDGKVVAVVKENKKRTA
ncbi:hypothetical protein [Acetivibrio straminisolvens]|uniref:hypothetical protein n=1 Tax=Acetivibrio straminisolvens TaxID=253314 RepID=UPI00223F6614|nr:hypothetical protein [Acetivibrio straminisolvens]